MRRFNRVRAKVSVVCAVCAQLQFVEFEAIFSENSLGEKSLDYVCVGVECLMHADRLIVNDVNERRARDGVVVHHL